MPEKGADIHDRLLQYIGVLVIGVIAFVIGLSTLPSGWITAFLGGGIAAYGGFEVRLTYNRIQIEEQSIRASQGGRKNTQINQTNPRQSPNIFGSSIGTINYGTTPPSQEAPAKSSPPQKPVDESKVEWLNNGHVKVDRYQEFEAPVNKGDRIEWQLESDTPITLQIMSKKNFETLADILDDEIDEDEEYSTYYSTPLTQRNEHSWVSPSSRTVMVVLTGGTIDEGDEDFSANVDAQIKIVRAP